MHLSFGPKKPVEVDPDPGGSANRRTVGGKAIGNLYVPTISSTGANYDYVPISRSASPRSSRSSSRSPSPVTQPMRPSGTAGSSGVHSGRIVKKTAPVVKKTAPVSKKTVPVSKNTAPVVKKTAPVGKKTVPVGKKTAPVGKKTTQVGKKTSRVIAGGEIPYNHSAAVAPIYKGEHFGRTISGVGTSAVNHEIAHYQRTTGTIIPKALILRIIKKIMKDTVFVHPLGSSEKATRVHISAFEAIHHAVEELATTVFISTAILSESRGASTSTPKDLYAAFAVAKVLGPYQKLLHEHNFDI